MTSGYPNEDVMPIMCLKIKTGIGANINIFHTFVKLLWNLLITIREVEENILKKLVL